MNGEVLGGSDVFVVMGAAVRPDGEPSGAMRRRVEGAVAASHGSADPVFLVTGGVGRHGPAESSVMARLLFEAGVTADRIVEESASDDTLSSIVNCAGLILASGAPTSVTVCSDRYHLLRCRWLLRLCGVRASAAEMPSGVGANGLARWVFYYVREVAALPLDTLLVLFRRARGPRSGAVVPR